MNSSRVVILGGGNGTSTLLKGMKHDFSHLTAILSMADDGGSTGELRREFGVLPPGDVRQCLLALSNKPELEELFSYRFDEGRLEGHSFGNLFLAAAQQASGSFEAAIGLMAKTLGVRGKVLPVTADNVHLVLENEGQTISGEFRAVNTPLRALQAPPQPRLEPTAHLLPAARDAILTADFVVIAPGHLYTSLAPALIVEGMKDALMTTKAKVVYICNLLNTLNQTKDFKVQDYAREIERFIGAPCLDYVFYNTRHVDSKSLRDNEQLVLFDENELAKQHYQAMGLALSQTEVKAANPKDKIAHTRASLGQDGSAVSQALLKLSEGA